MSTVAVSESSLALDLNLPTSSSLTIVADGETDGYAGDLAALRISIHDSDLASLDAAAANASTPLASDASVVVTGYASWPPASASLLQADPTLLPLLSSVSSKSVLSDLSTTLAALDSVSSGVANFDIPVINKALHSITSVADAVSSILSGLTWAGVLEPQLSYHTVCAGGDHTASSTEAYTISINSPTLKPATCSFTFPALTPANLQTALTSALDSGLHSCTLPDLGIPVGSVLAGSVLAPFVSPSTGATCTVVSLHPRVPGLVRSFAMSTSVAHPILLPSTAQWSVTSVPLFASWSDIIFVLEQAGISALIKEPKPVSVKATELPSCVPDVPGWAPYFDGTVPGTSLELQFNRTLFSGTTHWEKDTLGSGRISLDLPGGSGQASVIGGIKTELAIVHGCAPLRSSKNITIETSFVNGSKTDAFSTARVPHSGAGFTLTASFVVRTKDGSAPPQPVSVEQYISLPPGKLVAQALLEDVIPSIVSKDLAAVMSAVVIAPNKLFNPGCPQVGLGLSSRINPETNHLVLPFSFSISNITSTLRGLSAGSPVMSQSRSVLSSMDMYLGMEAGLSTSPSPSSKTISGNLGPVSLTTETLASRAAASLSLSAKLPYLTTAMALKAGTSASSLFSAFALDISVSGSASVSDIELDAFDHPVPGLPTLSLGLGVDSANTNILAPSGLTTFLDSLQATPSVVWSGDDSLVKMIKALVDRNSTVCDLLTAGVGFLHDVQEEGLVQAPLAPVSHSPFSHVLSKLIPVYDDAVSAVCSRGEPMSVALFCAYMSDILHTQVGPVCTNVSLAHNAFRLPLSFTPYSYSYTDASVLNPTLFNGGKGLTVGVAASNNLALSSSTTVTLTLVLQFGESIFDTHISLDPAGTGVEVDVSGSDDGSLKMNFGPFQANVGSSHAWLDGHLDATLAGVKVTGSTGFDASIVFPFVATDKCEVSVSVPDLGHPTAPVASNAGCKDFTSDLHDVMSKSWMQEFFSRPGGFWSDFASALASLRAKMFGPASPIGKYAIAFIDKKLGTLLDGDLAKITGPEVASQIIHQIAVDMVDELAGITVSTTIEEIIVEIVTGALNKYLPFLSQPVSASTDPSTRSVTWNIVFGHTAIRPLININSEWGDHGFLELDVQCDSQLEAEWHFEIDLVYSATKGITLSLPSEPAFTSSVTLNMPGGCTLVGGVGPLGFEMVTTSSDTFLNGQVNIAFEPSFDVELVANAQLGGEAYLGAGPLIAELAHESVQEALMTFIHYQAGFTAGYDFNLAEGQTSTTPTKLHFEDVEMCLGTMLTKLIDAMFAHVEKVVDPLAKVFGPNGFFLKPIPGMDKIFGSNFNALKVASYFCELTDDCNIKTLVDAIEVFERIMAVMSAAEELTELGIEGCGFTKALGSFEVALTKPVLVPSTYLPPKTKALIYKSTLAREHELEISKFVDSVTTSGHFGVVYNILQEPLPNFMDLMMGTNFALVGVSIPSATLAVGAYIPIPIFGPVPYVVLALDFKASITVSVGEVALTYYAVYDAIKFHQPSYLFRGLGITAETPSGSKLYPVVASASMTGSVTVGVLIFEGYGYAGLAIAAKLSYNNPTGSSVITFDQIGRLVKAGGVTRVFDGQLTLTFNYGLGIRACVHLAFIHKCWNIVHWGGQHTLFSEVYDHTSIPSVSSGSGVLDMGMVGASSSSLAVGSGPMPTFMVDDAASGHLWMAYDSGSVPVGSAIPTRGVAPTAAPVVRMSGTPGADFVLLPRTTKTAFALPSLSQAHLVLPMSYHAEPASGSVAGAPLFSASALKVSASGSPGVSLGSTCGSITLSEPVEKSVILVQGTVCPLSVQMTYASNVSISGSPSSYHGHGVVVSGTNGDALFVDLDASTFTIQSDSVVVDGMGDVQFGSASFDRLGVHAGLGSAASFTLASVPKGVATHVAGGNEKDSFEVPELENLDSFVNVDGAGGSGNVLSVSMGSGVDFADVMTDFVLGGVSGTSQTHGVGFANIQTVNVGLTPTGNKGALYVAIPNAGTDVNMKVTGTSASDVLTYDLRGCTGSSTLSVSASGSGSHEIHLGLGSHSLSQYECTIHVSNDLDSAESGNVRLYVHASRDERPLMWSVEDGSVVVTDTSGKTTGVTVAMHGPVAHAQIELGSGVTQVEHATRTSGIEVVYHGNGTLPTGVHVVSTKGSMLVTGVVDEMVFGNTGSHPLGGVVSPVLVACTSSGRRGESRMASFNMTSLVGASAPAQWFVVEERVVFTGVPETGASVPVSGTPSTWLSGLATSAGVLPYPKGVVGSPAVAFGSDGGYLLNVATGGGRDGVVGRNLDGVSLGLNLGSGIDLFDLLGAGENLVLGADMGPGVDFVNVVGPVNSDAVIAMGSDGVADVTTFWAPSSMDPLSPSLLKGDTVVPCGFGPGGSSSQGPFPSMVVEQLTTDDAISLLAGEPVMERYPWLSGYYGGSPSVVNVTAPVGGHLSFDLRSESAMQVVQIPTSAVVTFSARSSISPSNPVAHSWDLEIALDAMGPSRSILVEGAKATNGTVRIVLPPPGEGVVYDVSVDDLGLSGEGRVSVGGLKLIVQNVDVVVVDATVADARVAVGGSGGGAGMSGVVVLKGSGTRNGGGVVTVPNEFWYPIVVSGMDVASGVGGVGGVAPLVNAKGPLALVGGRVSATLDGGDVVSVAERCVKAEGGVEKVGWPGPVVVSVFGGMFGLDKEDVAVLEQGCGAVVFGVDTLSLAAKNMTVTGLASGLSAGAVVAESAGVHVVLEGGGSASGAEWASVGMKPGDESDFELSVVNGKDAAFGPRARFSVSIPSSGSVDIGMGVLTDAGTVDVNCTGYGSGPRVVLEGEASLGTDVSIVGGGCNVWVGSSTKESKNVPAMSVGGRGVGVKVAASLPSGGSVMGKDVPGLEDGNGQLEFEMTRTDGTSAAVSVAVEEGGVTFGSIVVDVGGGEVVAEMDRAFAARGMSGGSGSGNVPVLAMGSGDGTLVLSEGPGGSSSVIVQHGRVAVSADGSMSVEYCGDSGCDWTCYSASQCAPSQVRADAMFGGPCNNSPTLSKCVSRADMRVTGVVSPSRRSVGMECDSASGTLVVGGREGKFAGYSRGRIGFVIATAIVVMLGSVGWLVFSERGLDYGLNHVFTDRMGWARFVVFGLVSRNRLWKWSGPTVDIVAGAYQMVADLGAGSCSDVEPKSKANNTLWVSVTGALFGLSVVSVVLFGASQVLASRRSVRYTVWAARLGRATLGLSLFVFLIPAVANAFHDMLAILFMLLTCGTTLAALGLDIFRLRLLVVKSGTMITVDRPGRGSQILTGVTFTLCLGAAFVAALFGGRSRSSLSITGSMVLWCIALVSELVIPVWTLMSRTTRSVGWSLALHAIVTSIISGGLGLGALVLLDGAESGTADGVFALWTIAFWGQWISTLVLAWRSNRVEGVVEGTRVGMWSNQRFSRVGLLQAPLLGSRGDEPGDVTELSPGVN